MYFKFIALNFYNEYNRRKFRGGIRNTNEEGKTCFVLNVFCWNCGAKMKKPTEETELLNDVAKNESIKESAVSIQGEACDYTKLPTEKKSGIRGIYFFDFIMRLGGKANIPLCIYLVLNVVIIGLIATAFLALPIGWGMLAGLLLYIASIAIAISPIGEAIIRHQNGCKKIQDAATINRLEPLFREKR